MAGIIDFPQVVQEALEDFGGSCLFCAAGLPASGRIG